ncbi:uncharacterized protein [Pseudorasbora parva]|uniref:uncharacterized protein n=1 Tax=Pseudorasbora parva TaxID=51549 RepID=UPI00351F7FCD
MKSVLPVKMLAVLALVLLVFSATEGRILSKCELKAQLDAAQFQVIPAMGEKINVSHLIARLVCKANSSGFDTSFVKAIMEHDKEKTSARAQAGATPRGRPQAPAGGPAKPHTQTPTKGPHGSSHEAARPHLNATAKVVGQMYGVFQLSGQLACDSGMMPSLNICNMSCSALIDEDISNDIACLKTLINSIKPKPTEKPTGKPIGKPTGKPIGKPIGKPTGKPTGKPIDVDKILEMLKEKTCLSVVPSKYFAECA